MFCIFLLPAPLRSGAQAESDHVQQSIELMSTGDLVGAEREARLGLRDSSSRPDAWTALGIIRVRQKKYAEAAPLLLEGYQGMLARKNRIAVPDWYHLDRAREWLIELYQAWGKPEKAAEWRKK